MPPKGGTLVTLQVHWECEIRQQLKASPRMQVFFDTMLDTSPIKVRECFFGDRTEAIRLYLKAKEDQTIKYLDFNSLYPYTNFITSYPVGHPRSIDFDDNSGKQTWTQPSHNPYTGLLKVLIEPPQRGR
uniref:DNA-directed DNA polymerase n=1 Tax=Ditylenchus dipsaci TaxID=166011 RepID=A0A915DKY6_9BILA